jgi:hypothetical protein
VDRFGRAGVGERSGGLIQPRGGTMYIGIGTVILIIIILLILL